MNKILILKSTKYDPNLRNTDNCEIFAYYRVNINNLVLRFFRRFDLIFTSIFFDKWKKNISKYNTIILFDNGYHKVITSYIRRKNPNAKIVLWFWNPIIEYSKKYLLDENLNEIWTYDKADAKKYNLMFSPQFFNKEITIDYSIINYDVLFLGLDKGRKSIIEKYDKIFKENKLNTNIKIIENERDSISYDEYLLDVGKSIAILDIVNDNVSGLTLRCMESLFLNKKLITNNKSILEYDFYNSYNIFVLGVDDLSKIKEFIKKPYKKINNEIIDFYEYESWLKRVGDN